MAGKQLISEVVDKVAVRGELSELSKALKDIDTQIRNMSQVSIGGRKNGSDFKKINEQMIQEIAKSEAALAKLQTAIANKNAALDKAAAAQLIAEQKIQNAITQTEIINNRAAKSQAQNAGAAAAAKQREQKQNDELINDYKQLSMAYNDASLKAKNYALQLGLEHPVTVQAIADANSMGDQLKKLDAAVGQHQRNVGNYASGWQSFNYVIRETPNFAISATTGIQALSNNIPMFADEVKKARDSGKSWVNILKELGANLFSFGGIATLATIALTALPKIVNAMASEVDKNAKKFKSFEEVQTNAAKAIINEKIELEALLVVARDERKTKEEKSAAVKKINDIMPDYLGDIKLESINTKEANDKISGYIDQLQKKALAQAYITKIQDLYTKSIDIENSSIMDNIEWYQKLWIVVKNGQSPTQMQIDLVTKGVMERAKAKKAVTDEITALKNKFDEDLKNGNAILDLDKKEKESKEKKHKKTKDLKEEERKFLYEMNKAILEAQAANLDQIAKDETNSYAVRLAATQEYLKKVNQIAELQRSFEINTPKINNAEKLKIQSEFHLKTVENENKMLTAIRELKKEHDKKVLDEQKKAQDEAEKARVDKIDQAEQKINSRVLRDQEQLNKELSGLNDSFILGDIKTYEDYQKKKDEIALKYAVKSIEHQIEATQALLATDLLSTDQRQKYATELAELKKKLTDSVIEYEKKGNKVLEKEDKERNKRLLKSLQDIQTAVSSISTAIADVASIGFEKRAAALEEERNAIEKNAAAEVKRINDSTLSEQQKADKLKILEADKQTRLEINERKNRQLMYERAKFERLLNIGNIITGTALAVVKALPNIPLSIAVGIAGAAALYKAVATPLPKFAKGTNYAPEGYALTDEEGAELYIEPSGKTYLGSDEGANIKYLERGTKIIPHNEINKMLMQHMLHKTLNMMERTDNTSKKLDELKEVTVWSTLELKKAMSKQKGTTVIVNNNAAFNARINKYVHE